MGPHWDRRVVYNDFMIAHATNDAVYSSFTFALLEDTGWYDINWEYTRTPIYGYHDGCTFHTDKCVKDGETQFPEFCADSGERGCDIFHLHKGYCDITEYDYVLPPHFQYFEDKKIGGTNSYIDYCPIIEGYSSGNSGSLYFWHWKNFGEKVCTNCRCLVGTLHKLKWNLNFSPSGRCYEIVSCESDYAVVKVGDQEVNCSFTGGQVDGWVCWLLRMS